MRDRTTEGKPAYGVRTHGDPALAASLVDALAAIEPVDRWTHGFHTYPAGLHPDAAAALVAAFEGDTLLDPFCGGGTTLVEGRAAGRRVLGRDLSETALRVSIARAATPTDEQLTAFRSTARKMTEAARGATEPPPARYREALQDWYAPHVLCELASLRRDLAQVDDPAIRAQLEACFSSILVKVSWRKSDTSAQRVKHDRPRGTTAVLFHKKVRELARRQTALREAVPEGTPEADVRGADARNLQWPEPVDLVLTSPPYPSVYDYLPLQHLRRVWLGGEDPKAFEAEIGPRREWRQGVRAARRSWRDDTHAWQAACARVLRPGGHLVIVIGDGLTPAGPVDTVEPTRKAAAAAGLQEVAWASLQRPDHARGSSRWEHVFAFRRP